MSQFRVDIRRISKVWEHTNAERLSIASVEGLGFQFVIGKDSYKVGDVVAYFPVDSVLPEPLQELFALTGKLRGKKKDRLASVRLRGEISQGFVGSIDKILPMIPQDVSKQIEDAISDENWRWLETFDLAPHLGVEKYEPPMVACHACNLVHLPADIPVYDIEGCDRFPQVVETLRFQPVYITEKLEGQNFGVSSFDGEIVVNQRNYVIKPIEGHVHSFYQVVEDLGLGILCEGIRKLLGATKVTLRGEFLGPGVQKNIYGLAKHEVKLFDIMVMNGCYLGWKEINEMMTHFEILKELWVPVLFHGILNHWLEGKTIGEAAHGTSVLADTLREGIVIKPMTEQQHGEIGRLIIKQRDAIYCANHGC